MTPVRLEPAAPQSRVKHSTTELPNDALLTHLCLPWVGLWSVIVAVPGHIRCFFCKIFTLCNNIHVVESSKF